MLYREACPGGPGYGGCVEKEKRTEMDWLLFGIDILATVAFALSGALLAIQKRLDLFGVVFVGGVASVGGGILRDVLLGQIPPRMFYNYHYVLVATVVSLAVFCIARQFPKKFQPGLVRLDAVINFCDAIGLGLFAVSGTQAAMDAGHGANLFLCVFSGMTTGAGGGILRDIICGEVPAVWRKHIYALAAIFGSIVYLCMEFCQVPEAVSTLAATVATTVVRLLAAHYRWNLPRIQE